MSSEINTRVVTSLQYPVRVSYFKGITGVVKKDKDGNDKPREWSTMILIPKEDKSTVNKIKSVITAVAKEKWGDNLPKALKISFRDGDKEGKGGVPEGTDPGSEPFGGHYFMNIRTDRKPEVVDQNMNPITDAGGIVSGDYVIVSMNCYWWDNQNGKGISFGLGNIQLVKKGEPLDGKVSATKEFEPIAGVAEDMNALGEESSDAIFNG